MAYEGVAYRWPALVHSHFAVAADPDHADTRGYECGRDLIDVGEVKSSPLWVAIETASNGAV